MPDVRTGKLRERVDIYQVIDTSTGFGGTVPENVLYWQTYANVRPLQSSKSLLANQEQVNNGFYITIRYRKDKVVNKNLRMLYRGKWLNLTSLDNDDILKEYVVFVGTYKETTGGESDLIIDGNGA